MSFPFGWSVRNTAMRVENHERTRRLTLDQFASHQNPKAAAKATISLRSAYPWMSPNLAAKLGSYGVPVDHPDIAEVAGASLARRARRGWTDQGVRRNAREVRNVMASPSPWRSLDRTPPGGQVDTVNGDMTLGPTSAEMIGLGINRGTDQSSSLQAERERLAFDYARVPSAGVFQGATPAAVGGASHLRPEQVAMLDQQVPGAQMPILSMAEEIRGMLPSLDTTARHIRRGGLTFQGIPLPGGEVTAQELRDAYSVAGVADTLEAKRRQLEAQYPDLAGSSYPAMPGGITPSMRAVYDGIVSALDEVIGPERQSMGPDIGNFNVSDLWNAPYDATKATVRTATTAMDSIWQYTQASFRRMVDSPSDYLGFQAPWSEEALVRAGQPFQAETDLGITLDRLAAGAHVDAGEGFFVSPDSGIAQIRLRNERGHGTIGGHVITMGRWSADRLGLEPDTTPFNIVSGAVDLGVLLYEPGGALVDAAARSRRLRQTLARAGGFTATRSVSPDRFSEWLRSRDADRVISHFADLDPTDDLAVYRSRQMMSDSGGAARMPGWAHDTLARGEIGDRAYVEEMLANFTGMGYRSPGVPVAGAAGVIAPGVAWRRRLNRSRLAQESPETGAKALDIYDADGFVSGLESSLRNARVDEDTIARLVGRAYEDGFTTPSRVLVQRLERQLADMPESGEVFWRGELTDATVARSELMDELDEARPGLFINRPSPRRNVLRQVWMDGQEAKRARLVEAGVDPTRAGDLTHLDEVGRRVDTRMADDMQSEGAYWLRLTTDESSEGAVNRRVWGTLDGEDITDLSSPGFAHMSAEHLSRYLPLEDDYRQLARLTRSTPNKVLNAWLSGPRSGQLYAPWRGLDEFFMSKVWKPSRLIRPAYPIRVVGEEQARLAAAGLDSAFNHPMSAFALVMGTRRDGRLHRALDAVTAGRIDDVGNNVTDALGTPWEAVTEFTQAQNLTQRTWMIPTGGGSGGRFVPAAYLRMPDGTLTPGYAGAWTDLLARAHSDDLMRRIAQIHLGVDSQYDTIDDLIEAGGPGVSSVDELRAGREQNIVAMTRADLMDSHPQLGMRGDRSYAARYGAAAEDEAIANWDDYVESLQVRLFEITGRDPDLMHTVARGRFPDAMPLDTPNSTRINRAAARRLESKYADIAPPAIPGDAAFHETALGRRGFVKDDGYDRALERAFALFGAIPTDRLSRSPAFRQFYVRRMQELMPHMTDAAQTRFLQNAEELMRLPAHGFHLRLSAYIDEADSTSPTLASLRRAKVSGKGEMDLEMADELARHAALDNTRWLLYDVHRRGLFMDALRVVFPFGEAWKEVATRWLQLTAQRPGTVLQRGTQVVQATGSPQDWEEVVEDPSQHGHIFTNSTGETVFTYPAAEWFTAAMTGVPVELTGALNGLTMLNSVVPGVGPAIQVPLSAVGAFRDSPELEAVREVLFPFGLGPDPKTDIGGAISDLVLSPAVQRVFQGIAAGGLEPVEVPGTDLAPVGDAPSPVRDFISGFASIFAGGSAPENDRLFLNSVFDVMRYRVSAGDGSTDSQSAINRLIRESTRDAGLLYLIRGLAGMTLPSAPIPEFQVRQEDGPLLMLRALSDRYRQMQGEDYSTASQRFLDTYGQNLGLVLQSKTVPRTTMLPVTAEADRWVQRNAGVMEDYPLTFGLWAPGNTGEGDFDFEAYNRYVNRRAMKVLGRELELRDLVYLANDRAASLVYRQREEELLADPRAVTEGGNLTSEAQAYMSSEVAPYLREQYPGFGSDGLERGPSADDLRDALGRPGQTDTEVRRAVQDRRIAAPLRDALGQYLSRHDELLTELRLHPDRWDDSTTYFESSATRSMRDHLRLEVAPFLRSELPAAFRGRWDVIVERLLDRVMIPVWQEEGESALEVAA